MGGRGGCWRDGRGLKWVSEFEILGREQESGE
jgi:hypothetical protein